MLRLLHCRAPFAASPKSVFAAKSLLPFSETINDARCSLDPGIGGRRWQNALSDPSSNRPGRRQREALDTWRFQDNFSIYAQKGTHAAQNRAKLLATFQWLLRSGFQPLRSGSIPAKQTLFLNLYWKHAQFAFSGVWWGSIRRLPSGAADELLIPYSQGSQDKRANAHWMS